MNTDKSRYFLKPALLVLLVVFGNAAIAQSVIYTDQAASLKQVKPGYYLETFDSLPVFTGLLQPAFFSANGFSYNANATYFGSDQRGLFSVSPDSTQPNDIALSTTQSNAAITLTFTSGNVTAIGGDFFLTDDPGNAVPGDVTVTLNDGTTQILTATSANPQPFVGFTSASPISSLILTIPQTFRYATINNFVVGTAVPEPGAVALLLGIGSFGSFCLLRRHHSRK